jgi:V-type H+-transporting ATPase subunit H
MLPKVALAASPVALAFPHIQWDPLGSLRLTAQETALLRMAETNPIEYTLADSRDASMYARVLLKLLAEASAAGAGSGAVSRIHEACTEEQALDALDSDPLGVATHYTVTKLYEILSMLISGTGVTISSVFYVGKEGILVDQWKALLRMLNKSAKGDVWAQSGAALCLALILMTACPSQKNANFTTDEKGQTVKRVSRPTSYASAVEPLEALTAWIVSQLKMSSSSSGAGYNIAVAIPAMTALMNCTESRLLFAASGGVKYLARHLRQGGKKQSKDKVKSAPGPGVKNAASVQQLYELTFCLWCMTYELNGSASVRADFAKDGQAVAALTDLVAIAPREKVVRVSLAALLNLATCTYIENPGPASMPTIDGHTFLTEMLACGLLKSIEFLKVKACTDIDMMESINSLNKLLLENFKEMTRWEVYKVEVESGHLMWGTVHTEAFFKENANMMEGKDGDFKLLKILISLCTSKDEDVVAIACYDIGEFVRHYPNGRMVAKRLGAKETIMPLIEHGSPEVQRHALQCVSKLMVQHWQFVQ